MKTSYGVVWREDGAEQPGYLALEPHSLRFGAHGESAAGREVAFDAVAAVELRPADAGARSVVLLRMRDGSEVEIESAVDKWILGELAERVFVHSLGGGRGRQRVLVALALRPECRDAARALLEAGPPFDPSATALVLHDVFLLEEEALFLFETDDGADLEQLVEARFWRATAAWRELAAGGVRLAEHPFSWTRDEVEAG